MRVTLAKRAYSAWRVIEDDTYKPRIIQLEAIEERGFALLLYWNQIESAMKLMRYGYEVKSGWPDKLEFINSTWKPLQDLRAHSENDYALILGSKDDSLWKKRNAVAHEGCSVDQESYERYVSAVTRIGLNLKPLIPDIDRLKEIKRRSEAQSNSIRARSTAGSSSTPSSSSQ